MKHYSYFKSGTIALALIAVFIPHFGNANENLDNGKVVFAHMTNTIEAVDWAIATGVNGLEMDLRFDNHNMPEKFRHSAGKTDPCDCSASFSNSINVCSHLKKGCIAEEDAASMLVHLASSNVSDKLAVLYIDSKVDVDNAPPDISRAGKNVIQFLDKHLFANGYQGQVIISAGNLTQLAYIRSAIEEANISANQGRYYFTFDAQSVKLNPLRNAAPAAKEFHDVIQTLINLGTKNRVYSVGITAIAPMTFYDQVALSSYHKKVGVLASTGIWTIDNESAMVAYLNFGVDSIMTNTPTHALLQFKVRNIALAKPGQALRPATNDSVITRLPTGEVCESNLNCENMACGRATADDHAPKVCCLSGKYGNYAGYDYCYGMPGGSRCWSDAMCASHHCKGNAFGVQRGHCQ